MELNKDQELVAKKRYLQEEETWEECCKRVSNAIARAESKNNNEWIDKFFQIIYNLDFIPGGRILRNSGKIRGSLTNCHVLPLEDSIEDIGETLKNALITWSNGGGTGINFSNLRPKTADIKGKGGKSSGVVTFLESFNEVAGTIESGGQRRAAAIALLDISHPEILDFIKAKTEKNKLSHFNISVIINEKFLEAVERNDDWNLEFNQKIYKTLKARELWDSILRYMITSAEPGLINWDQLTKNNSHYFAPIAAVNPCITGDTLIAVADGRNAVSIKQLTDEKRDIPVYCQDLNAAKEGRKKIVIKMARNPHLTREKAHILKITLDDGSFVKTTGDHNFMLRDGRWIEAKELKRGDSLMPFNTRSDNHKVENIEYAECEDVYNMTIDDNHNYMIITNYREDKSSTGVCVKNCSELPLEKLGSCCLGSLNLPHFMSGHQTNLKKLEETIEIAIRFLDNVLDITVYPIPEMREVAEFGRRIGLGTMGLADFLFLKEIRYGSEESISEIEKLYKFIRDCAYKSSIKIAKEKGSFPKFNKFDYCRTSFIRKLPVSIRSDIKQFGIRNVTLLTCPPTGTTALLAGSTSGIEPLFSKAYSRKDRISERIYIHPMYEKFLKESNVPKWFVDSHDVLPKEHFEISVAIQKYTDGAISKTINLPEKTTVNDLGSLLLEYMWNLKGVAIYVDKSRDKQVLYPLTIQEAIKYISKNKSIEKSIDESQNQCRSGTCDL